MNLVEPAKRLALGCSVFTAIVASGLPAVALEIDCNEISPIVVTEFSDGSALSETAASTVAEFAASAAAKTCPIMIIGLAEGEPTDADARTTARERAEAVVAALRSAGVPEGHISFVRSRATQRFADTPTGNDKVLVRPNPNAGFKCSALSGDTVGAAPDLAPIPFGRGVRVLEPGSLAAVDAIAETIKADLCSYTIGGYASSTGNRRNNRVLSLGRSQAVRAALIERGISAARLNLNVGGQTTDFGSDPADNRIAIITRD